jgi:predicted permease
MSALFRRLRYLFRQRQLEAELAEEMDFHRSMLARGSGGRTGAAFGNATLAREDARGVWIWRWAEDAWQDARYAVASMRRQPGFALSAIVIVALGAGATTCTFTLLDALVLRSLPVERPERLVWFRSPSFSYPIFADVRDRLPVFDGLFAWNLRRAYADWTGGGGELQPADVLEASSGFFSTLRVQAAAGRTFDERDGEAAAVAVITHSTWMRRYAGNPGVLGRTVRIGGVPYTIIGIAPAGFYGVAPGLAPDAIVPVASSRTAEAMAATTSAWLHLMGRLKDGLSISQADAALQAMWPSVMAATTHAGMPADRRARYLSRKTALEPGRNGFSRVRNLFGDPLSLIMGLAVLLLGVACASIANLLIARGTARRKEIAVRLAIGASHARVLRQLLTEALVLTLAGAAIGLVVASWTGSALVAFMTTSQEHLALDTSIGWRSAAFAAAVALAISLVAALPARLAMPNGVSDGLKEGGQPAAGMLRRWSTGKALVVVQVSLALVLLAGSAVFGRSLARILWQDTGLAVDRLLVALPDAAAAGYRGTALLQFHLDAAERLRAVPGVTSAGLSWKPPISNDDGNWTQSIAIDGAPLVPPDASYVYFNAVSAEYLATVGTPLVRGRGITDRDVFTSPRIVVVNESLARRFFDGQDPIGHRISIGKGGSRQDLEVVGIVRDAKYRTLQEPARSIAYLPLLQTREVLEGQNLAISIQTADPGTVGAAVGNTLRTLDPRVPVRTQTAAERIRESTLNERLIAGLAAVAGLIAVVLACAGIYGLLAFTVSRHAREIALRIALGATPASVRLMVQRESLVLAGVGVAAGLGAALALGRFIESMLFQVRPADPLALTAVCAIMLLVAGGSAHIPARRAASVDPAVALKRE